MKVTRAAIVAAVLFSVTTSSFAQKWEFGAEGGGGLLNSVSATGSAGSASAGFAPGAIAGVFVGENLYPHFSGEIRYEYMQSDLRLSAGGQTAQFSGAAHAIHYDMVYHTSREESPVQFFGVVGGGVKAFFGTGTEEAYQPLSQYGYFTKASALKPMICAGAGISWRLGQRLFFRAELRDFITGFPTTVLTPPQGVKYGSLLNDLEPMVGIVYAK